MLKFVNVNDKTERLIRDTFSEKELEQATRQYNDYISSLDPLSDISLNDIFEATPRLLINYNSTKAWFIGGSVDFEKVAKELGISAYKLKKQYYQCKKDNFWSFNELDNEIVKNSKTVSIDYQNNNVVLSIRGVWDDYKERISWAS